MRFINFTGFKNIPPAIFFTFFILLFSASVFIPRKADAEGASLYLVPSKGTFLLGNTFSVSIYADTKGNKINAVEVNLKFPPDILQVANPTAGESFISEWLTPPNYSNTGGTISFKGGIPEGIVTSAGLISTVTFRAKSPGVAKIEFSDSSKVLLADGNGTPILAGISGGSYEILVPPPEGPKIFSQTHPDFEVWYRDPNPYFYWEKEDRVTDFSYDFSRDPQEVPDIISEGVQTFKSYEGAADGIWYFHLRQKKDRVWGKPSHFPVKIDTTSPENFSPRADAYAGYVYFETKDANSGIDYYEVSILNINESPVSSPFFVEATSPFKIDARPGKYRVIVRAHDKAGNYQTGENGFQILSPVLAIEKGGIQLRGFLLSWGLISAILVVLFFGIIFLIIYLFSRKTGFKKGIKEIEEAIREIDKIKEREKEVEKFKIKYESEKRELEEKLK